MNNVFDGIKKTGDYTAGVLEPIDVLRSAMPREEQYVETIIPEPKPAAGENGGSDGGDLDLEAEEIIVPKKPLREQAHDKIESILNLRTFLVIAGATIVLGLYIYNLISINRLSGETEELKNKLRETQSLNVELEGQLKSLERSERIGEAAYQQLGLGFSAKQAIVIEKE
jgi:cell division protein FtsL